MYLRAINNMVTYNSNGSIMTLLRNGMKNDGTFGAIDDLTVTYDGNRLMKVTDDAEAENYNGALDFDDGADTTCEYDYDSNGALTRDDNRGINSITYDYSHHPSIIFRSTKKKTVYNDYTPDGMKLSSRHVSYIPTGNGGNYRIYVRDLYVDGLMLRDGSPLLWQFDRGYVDLNANGTPTSWNYYVTDHLGSTRMVVDSNDSIRETINYYPFGSEMQMTNPALMTEASSHPFRFTGKELDRQNGLNMYDFGARMYDVAGVPMWTSIDPLTEKNPNMTPYHFCHNNPVNRVDPDGMADYFSNTGKFIGSDNNLKDPYIYIQNKAGNTKLSNYNFGSGKKGLTSMMRIAFHYGKSVGATQGGTSIGVDAGMPAGTDSETLAYTTNDHHIRLMVKDGHFKDSMSQIYNMKSTLRHESYHDKGENGSFDSEVKTLMREIIHPEFNKTTESFQETTLKSLQDELIMLYKNDNRLFDNVINKAKDILEKHGMNGTPNYYDGGNSINF